jgi:peptidoglycan hydrolase CwlO-like protein
MSDEEEKPIDNEGWRERYMHTIGAYNRIVEENKSLVQQLEEQKVLTERAMKQVRHEYKVTNELLNELQDMKNRIRVAVDTLMPYMSKEE